MIHDKIDQSANFISTLSLNFTTPNKKYIFNIDIQNRYQPCISKKLTNIKKRIPNSLTILRIALIPVLVFSFSLEAKTAKYVVTAIFILASITDYIDGVLARKWQAHSNLGRMLDPIADKMIVSSTLIMMVSQGMAPVIPIVVILCREIFVSGMREHLAEIKITIKVSMMGKCKTALQMIAIIILLCSENLGEMPYIKTVGMFALWCAALLTVMSGYSYIRDNIHYVDK